jgi:hypothetical protein
LALPSQEKFVPPNRGGFGVRALGLLSAGDAACNGDGGGGGRTGARGVTMAEDAANTYNLRPGFAHKFKPSAVKVRAHDGWRPRYWRPYVQRAAAGARRRARATLTAARDLAFQAMAATRARPARAARTSPRGPHRS